MRSATTIFGYLQLTLKSPLKDYDPDLPNACKEGMPENVALFENVLASFNDNWVQISNRILIPMKEVRYLSYFELQNPPNLWYHRNSHALLMMKEYMAIRMKPALAVYNELKGKVTFLYRKLKLFTYEHTVGRNLSLSIIETITLALYKQTQHIQTKIAIWRDFRPPCSYKTLVVNMNRRALLALFVLMCILRLNRSHAHPIKHTDSTDVPVCLNKNANSHKTMSGLASWGYSGKGWFYGLKLHLTSDLHHKMLAVRFSPGNTHGTKIFNKLNDDMDGIFVADAEYVSEKLQREFYREHQRILFAQPRKNMKKLITAFQYHLYNTRMLIELNFRNLKLFYGLITSLPRSVNGYLANYVYSILAYALR